MDGHFQVLTFGLSIEAAHLKYVNVYPKGVNLPFQHLVLNFSVSKKYSNYLIYLIFNS
jgi:hypothetical protein